jgi:hypothetical protein
MYLALSILLATAAPTNPETSKKQIVAVESEEETVYLENPDDLPLQEIVIDESVDDFFSDLEEEEE